MRLSLSLFLCHTATQLVTRYATKIMPKRPRQESGRTPSQSPVLRPSLSLSEVAGSRGGGIGDPDDAEAALCMMPPPSSTSSIMAPPPLPIHGDHANSSSSSNYQKVPQWDVQVVKSSLKATKLNFLRDTVICQWLRDACIWLRNVAQFPEVRFQVLNVLASFPWMRLVSPPEKVSRNHIRMFLLLEKLCYQLMSSSVHMVRGVLEVVMRAFLCPLVHVSPNSHIQQKGGEQELVCRLPIESIARIVNHVCVLYPHLVPDVLLVQCLEPMAPKKRWPYLVHHLGFMDVMLRLAFDVHLPPLASMSTYDAVNDDSHSGSHRQAGKAATLDDNGNDSSASNHLTGSSTAASTPNHLPSMAHTPGKHGHVGAPPTSSSWFPDSPSHETNATSDGAAGGDHGQMSDVSLPLPAATVGTHNMALAMLAHATTTAAASMSEAAWLAATHNNRMMPHRGALVSFLLRHLLDMELSLSAAATSRSAGTDGGHGVVVEETVMDPLSYVKALRRRQRERATALAAAIGECSPLPRDPTAGDDTPREPRRRSGTTSSGSGEAASPWYRRVARCDHAALATLEACSEMLYQRLQTELTKQNEDPVGVGVTDSGGNGTTSVVSNLLSGGGGGTCQSGKATLAAANASGAGAAAVWREMLYFHVHRIVCAVDRPVLLHTLTARLTILPGSSGGEAADLVHRVVSSVLKGLVAPSAFMANSTTISSSGRMGSGAGGGSSVAGAAGGGRRVPQAAAVAMAAPQLLPTERRIAAARHIGPLVVFVSHHEDVEGVEPLVAGCMRRLTKWIANELRTRPWADSHQQQQGEGLDMRLMETIFAQVVFLSKCFDVPIGSELSDADISRLLQAITGSSPDGSDAKVSIEGHANSTTPRISSRVLARAAERGLLVPDLYDCGAL